jgi:hypothetical protein
LACEFLGIAPVATSTDLTRTTPWSLSSGTEAFDGVAAVLRGTPYEWMTAEGR